MREDFTVIYKARTVPEAHELEDRLAEAGIEALVVDELEPGLTGTDAIGLPSPFSVAVHEDRADDARRIAEAFDQELVARAEDEEPEATEPADAGEAASREEEDDWPHCPECDARRVTVCPICRTSGSRFPSADKDYAPDAVSENQALLVCPTCDEPFVPQYLRQCEWCGHEFEEGIAPDHDHVPEQINPWAMALVLAVAALLVGMLVYFMIIL